MLGWTAAVTAQVASRGTSSTVLSAPPMSAATAILHVKSVPTATTKAELLVWPVLSLQIVSPVTLPTPRPVPCAILATTSKVKITLAIGVPIIVCNAMIMMNAP